MSSMKKCVWQFAYIRIALDAHIAFQCGVADIDG